MQSNPEFAKAPMNKIAYPVLQLASPDYFCSFHGQFVGVKSVTRDDGEVITTVALATGRRIPLISLCTTSQDHRSGESNRKLVMPIFDSVYVLDDGEPRRIKLTDDQILQTPPVPMPYKNLHYALVCPEGELDVLVNLKDGWIQALNVPCTQAGFIGFSLSVELEPVEE